MFALLCTGAPAPALSFESRAGAWGVWCASMASVWRHPSLAVACSRADCCALARVDGGSAVAARTSIARRDLLARDTAAHRAMLIVGRFLTGRRARQRTACFGTKGLALLNNANIASTDRPACLIASAAYCRVSYSTGLASIASHGALIARLQSAPAKPQSRAVLRKKRPFSLGHKRAWTTPDNRCFPKKWRLGRCNIF